MSDVGQRVEDISMALVMADASDLQALAALHEQLSELSAAARDDSYPLLAEAAETTAELAKAIILEEVPDATATLETVSRTVSAMQRITRDRVPEDEVDFPAELSLGSGGGDRGGDEADGAPVETSDGPATALDGDPELLSDFVTEATEHLDNADVQLLTLETNPHDADALNAVFRSFHTIKGVSGFLGLEQIKSLAHEAESLLDRARKESLVLSGRPIDVVFEAVTVMKRLIGAVSDAMSTGGQLHADPSVSALIASIRAAASGEGADDAEPEKHKKVGEILVESGAATREAVEEALLKQVREEPEKKLGEILVEQRAAKPEDVGKALTRQKTAVKETIKIDVHRVDRLVEMIGEIVIANSMVNLDVETEDVTSARLEKNLAYLTKTTRELQELGMSMRMVPVKSTFQKMARLVRDLARKAGKQVEFIMSGEDTELDRGVVEKIGDPLVHMVRNCVDHGIELPEERKSAGKSEVGHVELRAFYKGRGGVPTDIRSRVLHGGEGDGDIWPGRRHGRREAEHRVVARSGGDQFDPRVRVGVLDAVAPDAGDHRRHGGPGGFPAVHHPDAVDHRVGQTDPRRPVDRGGPGRDAENARPVVARVQVAPSVRY